MSEFWMNVILFSLLGSVLPLLIAHVWVLDECNTFQLVGFCVSSFDCACQRYGWDVHNILQIVLRSSAPFTHVIWVMGETCAVEPLCGIEVTNRRFLPSVVPALCFDPPASQVIRRAKIRLYYWLGCKRACSYVPSEDSSPELDKSESKEWGPTSSV